jgi:hypothetical protein
MPTMTASVLTQPSPNGPANLLPGLPTGAEAPSPASAAESSTTQAVESVLQVADLQAAASQGTQSSVNLRFDVAGENLSVRVAMQAGQVHTQFTTDSGELRAAIAHEWQSIGPAPEGAARLAEPVFTAESHGGSSSPNTVGGDDGQQSGQKREWQGGEADATGETLVAAPAAQAAVVAEPEPAAALPVTGFHSFA